MTLNPSNNAFLKIRHLTLLLCAYLIIKKKKKRTNFGRKQSLIIQLVLNPSHQVVYVLWSWAFNGLFYGLAISPMVLIFWPSRHNWAGFFQTKFCDSPIQHVDLIKKIHRWRKKTIHSSIHDHMKPCTIN